MKLISGDRSLCSRINLAAAGDLQGTVQSVQAAGASTARAEAAAQQCQRSFGGYCAYEGKNAS